MNPKCQTKFIPYFCFKCNEPQARLKKSQSLPHLSVFTVRNKLDATQNKVVSTQTDFYEKTDQTSEDDTSLRLSPKPGQDYSKSKKENSLLKQQLTRDSGIDSDNTHHQPLPKISGFKRPQQIFLTNKINSKHSLNNELNQTNAATTYKTVTSPMSKGPKSLTIKIIKVESSENGECIENSSTQYNKTDQDYQINNLVCNQRVSMEKDVHQIDKTAKIFDHLIFNSLFCFYLI